MTVVSAAVVQAVFSFLTAIIAAVLAVFIPLIAVIALVATLIGILASVSYTHLDVYKRQTVNSCILQ